jgi:hypothetical protein
MKTDNEANGHVVTPTLKENEIPQPSFDFLHGVASENTFRVAQNNLKAIFGSQKDTQGNDLLEKYGRDACLLVLARLEFIAIELKKALEKTELFDSYSKSLDPNVIISDESVTIIRRLMLDLTPMGTSVPDEIWQNYSKSVKIHHQTQNVLYGYDLLSKTYNYPSWDQVERFQDPVKYLKRGNTPQEISFYQKLITHMILAEEFVREITNPINFIIEEANQNRTQLPEEVFGYLKQENGEYRTIDTNRMIVRMLLHDIGRWVTHHQELHHQLPDLIAHFLNIKGSLIRHEFDTNERYLSPEESMVYPENIPIEEIIFHLTDFISKRSDESDLKSSEIRNLDRLVEYAIMRASIYNHKLKEYLENMDENTTVVEKVSKALEILESSSNTEEARYYEREIIFLNKVVIFFDGDNSNKGILTDANTSLNQIIENTQKKFAEMLDSGEFYAYNR